MKRLLSFLLTVSMLTFALPGEDNTVTYLGGTASLKPGASGMLDTSSATALTLSTTTGTLSIPYASITEYNYSREVARHLGIVAATVVPLVRKRERKHYLTIQYTDAEKHPQTAVLEIPKQMPRVILPVLIGKAPNGCTQHNEFFQCPNQTNYWAKWDAEHKVQPPVQATTQKATISLKVEATDATAKAATDTAH